MPTRAAQQILNKKNAGCPQANIQTKSAKSGSKCAQYATRAHRKSQQHKPHTHTHTGRHTHKGVGVVEGWEFDHAGRGHVGVTRNKIHDGFQRGAACLGKEWHTHAGTHSHDRAEGRSHPDSYTRNMPHHTLRSSAPYTSEHTYTSKHTHSHHDTQYTYTTHKKTFTNTSQVHVHPPTHSHTQTRPPRTRAVIKHGRAKVSQSDTPLFSPNRPGRSNDTARVPREGRGGGIGGRPASAFKRLGGGAASCNTCSSVCVCVQEAEEAGASQRGTKCVFAPRKP